MRDDIILGVLCGLTIAAAAYSLYSAYKGWIPWQ